MPQYLLANYLPDNFDPSTMTAATIQAISDLNDELEAAGARLMACGLAPPPRPSPSAASPTASPSSPTALTSKPRSTLAASGSSNAPTWTRP